MYYTNNEIVKALVDERLRRMSMHRMTGDEAAERGRARRQRRPRRQVVPHPLLPRNALRMERPLS